MKTILSLLTVLYTSTTWAGIPSTICSDASGGIRQVAEAPGVESIQIKIKFSGESEIIQTSELKILASNVHVIRENKASGRGDGHRGSYSKTYSATLNISRVNNMPMPDAYTTTRKADGSLEVDVICHYSVF